MKNIPTKVIVTFELYLEHKDEYDSKKELNIEMKAFKNENIIESLNDAFHRSTMNNIVTHLIDDSKIKIEVAERDGDLNKEYERIDKQESRKMNKMIEEFKERANGMMGVVPEED